MQLIPQDELLMERIRKDETRALDTLFNLYYNSVCSVIYYFIHEKELCEELGADVFIKLWDKRNTITITQNIRLYLLAMARNAALAELQKKKQRFADIEAADLNSPLVASEQDPEHALIFQQSSQLVTDAVNSIKENTRIIFCLSRDEGLKYREIADVLNISEKTVELHMSKALRHLRLKLLDFIQ